MIQYTVSVVFDSCIMVTENSLEWLVLLESTDLIVNNIEWWLWFYDHFTFREYSLKDLTINIYKNKLGTIHLYNYKQDQQSESSLVAATLITHKNVKVLNGTNTALTEVEQNMSGSSKSKLFILCLESNNQSDFHCSLDDLFLNALSRKTRWFCLLLLMVVVVL